jgi:glutathione S-transferase
MNETIPASAPLAGGMPASGYEGLELNVFGWPWTGLVTLFTLLVVFILAYQVGVARKKYQVPAPQMTGPDEFMRAFRAHANSVEFLVIFLPLLWMTAFAARDEIAAAIGVFWPLSRIVYAMSYYKEAKKRHVGFMIGTAVIAILFIISSIQIVRSLFIW